MMYANWIRQAREHWKEFLPAKYNDLKQNNLLEQALMEAAEATAKEMDVYRAQGFNETEAWELTRNLFLFPEPESEDELADVDAEVDAELEERYPKAFLRTMSGEPFREEDE